MGKKEKRTGHGPKKYMTWTKSRNSPARSHTPRTGLLVPVQHLGTQSSQSNQFASATYSFLPTTPLSVVSSLKQDKETKPRQPSLQIPSRPIQSKPIQLTLHTVTASSAILIVTTLSLNQNLTAALHSALLRFPAARCKHPH